jgi:FdhE protein
MISLDLTPAWQDLVKRRPGMAGVLAAYGPLLGAWAAQPVSLAVPALTCEECAPAWRDGIPVIVGRAPALPVVVVESFLEPALTAVLSVRPDLGPPVQRFTEAWDAGALGPGDLLPARGRVGSVPAEILDPRVATFVAQASLRPLLERWFAPVSECPIEGWTLGVCPLCGAPPTFADVLEDGRRRLACGFCGAGWAAARLWCPFCGNDRSGDLRSLQPDAMSDQGYAILVCGRCRGYVKELDRRVRWNGGPALVEDWGSPHLDLVAARAGYWRAIPTLVDLAEAGRPPGEVR